MLLNLQLNLLLNLPITWVTSASRARQKVMPHVFNMRHC